MCVFYYSCYLVLSIEQSRAGRLPGEGVHLCVCVFVCVLARMCVRACVCVIFVVRCILMCHVPSNT